MEYSRFRCGQAAILILAVTIMTVAVDGVVSASAPRTCGPRLVSGLFTRAQLPLGYTLVATLPRGACRVNVTEMHHSTNYLALKLTNGSFIINGNFAISDPGGYEAAGTRWEYRRQGGPLVEAITTAGPLTQPVDIMILYRHLNPGIKYEYTMPIPPEEAADKSSSAAVIAPPLINGPQRSEGHHGQSHGQPYRPTRLDENSIGPQNDPLSPRISVGDVDGNSIDQKRPEADRYPYGAGVLATESEKPKETQNKEVLASPVHPNPASPHQRHKRRKFVWQVLQYTPCTKPCAGMQTPILQCVRESTGIQAVERRCGPRPQGSSSGPRPCGGPCSPRWSPDSWSPCSASCGHAKRTRSISCRQDVSYQATDVKVDDALCLDQPPITSYPCQLRPCPVKYDDNDQLDVNNVDQTQRRNESNYDNRQNPRRDEIDNVIYQGSNDNKETNPRRDEPDHSNQGSRQYGGYYNNERQTPKRDPIDNGIYHGSRRNEEERQNARRDEADNSVYQGSRTGRGRASGTDRFSAPPAVVTRPANESLRATNQDQLSNEISDSYGGYSKGNSWIYSEWTQECSSECGRGLQTRTVRCSALSQGQLPGCDEKKKPAESRACSSDRKCSTHSARWFTGPWSPCSNPCAITGKMSREVVCLSYFRGQHRVSAGSCTGQQKPEAERSCPPSLLRADCQPEWLTGDWSQCLGPCGSTSQTRLVTCLGSAGVPSGGCPAPRPASSRDCVPSHCHLSGFTPAPRTENEDRESGNSLDDLVSNGECLDRISSCHLAVQARLCAYAFYAKSCCQSCKRAPSNS